MQIVFTFLNSAALSVSNRRALQLLEVDMKEMIMVLGLLFGAVAIWAVIEMFRSRTKAEPEAKPRSRAVKDDAPKKASNDPWAVSNLRPGLRETLPPGKHLF
jgi:hypothetical protein